MKPDKQQDNATVALQAMEHLESDERRVALYANVIAPGAPNELVALVHHYAHHLGLDPLRREVMLISFDRKDPATGAWEKDYAVIVNVHGLIKIASREKDYAGMRSGVVYPGENCTINAEGVVTHEYDAVKRSEMTRPGASTVLPVGAWATVTRMLHGRLAHFTTYLPFAQVAQTVWKDKWEGGKRTGKKEKVLRDIWAKRPDWMNEKCAIAFSVRKAYDHAIGRVYAPEEVGLASEPDGTIEAPAGSESGAVVLEDTTMEAQPEGTPSVEAGIIPGSERAKAAPSDELPDFDAPDDEPDVITDEPRGGVVTEPVDEGEMEAPSRTQRLEALRGAATYADSVFKRPKRKFLHEAPTGDVEDAYVVDSVVLTDMKKSGPVRIGDLTDEEVHAVTRAINGVTRLKEMARGRAES